MKGTETKLVGVVLMSLLALPVMGQITINPIGTYATGIFDEAAAEIVAHDPDTDRLFVTNAGEKTVDVLDISDPTNPSLALLIDVSGYGSPTSVDVNGGIVAVAVRVKPNTRPGWVVFFDADGDYENHVRVGPGPDMVTFTPDGNKVLTANEGEPSDEYTTDPDGSVSIIDISGGVANATVETADFIEFDDQKEELREAGVRIYGPCASVAEDLEPEYIAVSADSETAWVTLQENNALAIVDIDEAEVTAIVPLGYKDHLAPDNGLDVSNKDGGINIANWPVLGMYLPDGIAAYEVGGETYLITANEGDARDYDGFSEEARVKDLHLGPGALRAYPTLRKEVVHNNIGRLKTTTCPPTGKVVKGNAEKYNQIYSYGGRSFSIWTAEGELVFDSGDEFEQWTAFLCSDNFNSTDDENDTFDTRSDDKGPEPEGVAISEIGGSIYAFILLERIGGVMIYDVTDPTSPSFVDYVNNRDFSQEDPELAGDLSPEGVIFVPAADSPNANPLLVVANEMSGTTTIFEVIPTP